MSSFDPPKVTIASRLCAAAAMLFLASGACAATPPAKPKLIVAISVDQLSAQLFQEYRPTFTGGLKRVADGIVFANGYQAHAATETCPGHSTILTGGHPARTGIVANTWYEASLPRADKSVYCSEDTRVPGSTSRAYTVSDRHLKVDTLGDRMKAADPRTRVVAVGGKDRSAVMMGGHQPDQRWFWKTDRFVSTATAPAPRLVDAVNTNIAGAIARARPAMVVPPHCAPKDVAIPIGGGKTVGTHKFAREAGNARAVLVSPEVDGATLAMAAALRQELRLGQGPQTDLLAIGLAGTDYVGHSYGIGGVEMCLQLATLDGDLATFFEVLDRTRVPYAVVLTADHGGLDLPERARLQGTPDAARIDPAITPEGLGARVAAELGLTGRVFAGEYYLTAEVPAARRAAALAAATRMLRAHPQVEAVFTKPEIAATPLPAGRPEAWTIAERFRGSFDAARSSDLFVALKQNITPIVDPTGGYVATHGSVWDYDRKVPIAFWWRGAPRQDRPESAMTIDIMPTLAAMVGLTLPADGYDGRCLAAVANCPTAR